MQSIVLIGFMGSGKTTVGEVLAARSGAKFTDTDKIIESNEGKSISEIFETVGEEGFRRLENTVLSGLSKLSGNGLVISTGGGIVTKPENIPLLKKAGLVVWLRVNPETVVKRLEGDKTRPLLAGGDPLKKVEKLMRERQSCYAAAADVIIDCDDLRADEIVNLVLQKCGK